jgi:hypothetical protein
VDLYREHMDAICLLRALQRLAHHLPDGVVAGLADGRQRAVAWRLVHDLVRGLRPQLRVLEPKVGGIFIYFPIFPHVYIIIIIIIIYLHYRSTRQYQALLPCRYDEYKRCGLVQQQPALTRTDQNIPTLISSAAPLTHTGPGHRRALLSQH